LEKLFEAKTIHCYIIPSQRWSCDFEGARFIGTGWALTHFVHLCNGWKILTH